MPSDSGVHKRSNQNKKNKGSTGNIPDKVPVREKPVSKSSPDELIHVQKDVQFGDNWCKISVFFAISCALLGVAVYIWAGSNLSSSSVDKPSATSSDWIDVLRRLSQYYSYEPGEETIDEEPLVDTQVSEFSYLDILWAYYPFGQSDEQRSEVPVETTEQDNEISKESENEKESREDDSKESADEKLENDTDDDDENDQNDHESEEEDLDDEKKIGDDDDERDNDDGQKDNDDDDDDDEKTDDNDEKEYEDESNSAADDIENLYEPYKSSNHYSYEKHDREDDQKDTKDDDESNESKEQVDRRDQRFNYYHNRGSEEAHKYDYIKGEDDPNDSSENGGEKFDSEEKTEPENDEDTETFEDSSHSSEEVKQPPEERDELLEPEPPVEPESPEKDEPQSGNLVTKLSVGIALIFVAYSVIIRKWNNYVNQAANEADVIFRVASENDEDLMDIAQTIAENLLDSMNDSNSFNESSEAENKTLQDYLETPSNSANEQSEDDSVNERSAEQNLPMDSENSQTASETEESETDEESDYEKSNYVRMNVTNRDDYPYRHQLDDADEDWDNDNPFNASVKYSAILEQEPRSIRAEYGLVRFYDRKADDLQSNTLLKTVIKSYEKLLNKPHIPEALEKIIAERTVDRMKFMGRYDDAIRLLKVMIEKYPKENSYQIELAITYLILDKLLHAEILLGKIIQKEPTNGVALVNYGFIMKQKGELEKAAKTLSKGISTGEKGTQDSRFYYHLGEALQRLGRNDEALELYQEAAEKGVFPSKYQRSLYNVEGLNAAPWWDPAAIAEYKEFFQNLESNWKRIRDEVEGMLAKEKRNPFRDEAEQLREKGEWKQLELFARGEEKLACKNFPFTCDLIRGFAPAAKCRRGQVKFSIMEPGTHVWAHCGPSNCRLRAHLGLIVPDNVTIRVAEETRTWSEGKVILFDDSFEHEIWHNGTSSRLILIVDVWHPKLSDFKRKSLPPI